MTRQKRVLFYVSLLLGIIIVALSVYGFFLLRSRAGLPDGIGQENIIEVNGIKIKNAKEFEFILTQKDIGEWATFVIEKNGQFEIIKAPFTAYYSKFPFPLIYLFIGLFSYLVGFVLFIFKSEEKKARLLYRLALVFSFVLIVNGGTYCLRKGWLSYLPAILFFIFYPLALALLLHFSVSFSPRIRRGRVALIYSSALFFSGIFVTLILISFLASSIEAFRLFLRAFYLFRVYMIIVLILAIFHFIYLYRRTRLEENRTPIKWVFLGLVLGLSPFIFLYELPTILKLNPLLTEEFSSVFFAFIPLGFAFSIFKFKLFDIEFVINRSLAYSLLTIFTVSVYLVSVQVFQRFFSRIFFVRDSFISLGSALLAAVVFHPARGKIQHFVDKTFFRQNYDYRRAVLEFSEKAQKALIREEIMDLFLAKVLSTIPLEKYGITVYAGTQQENRLLLRKGTYDAEEISALLSLSSDKIWAKRSAANTEEGLDFSQEKALAQRGLEMAIGLTFQPTSWKGCFALGKKKSGQKFSRDDLDLLKTLVGDLVLNIERINLCEDVVYEKASKEKLDELNRLKTEFISTVSHELRTPLSSIQGLTEILQEGRIKDKAKREELLAVLSSESSRLSRMIHNILDFGKFEQQVKTFRFQSTELGPLITETVHVFRAKFESEGFTVRLNLPREPVLLDVDGDSIKQALVNLIDNAIKYSLARKEIEIALLDRQQEVEIQIKDKGIGISAEDQEKIFDKFYRASEAVQVNPKGIGIGLKIVRQIMTAHQGEIKIKSRPQQGSTFRLIFPRSENK